MEKFFGTFRCQTYWLACHARGAGGVLPERCGADGPLRARQDRSRDAAPPRLNPEETDMADRIPLMEMGKLQMRMSELKTKKGAARPGRKHWS